MFDFHLEPEVPLLTVTWSGDWCVDTVLAYEPLLRRELALLQMSGRPRFCILDIRLTGAPAHDVAAALRSVVARLGNLYPDRTAVVATSGIASIQALHSNSPDVRVFITMIRAREWIKGTPAAHRGAHVHDTPSDAQAEGQAVHVCGPSDVDIVLTPAAALETAKRISDAAVDVILVNAKTARLCRAEAE